MIVERKQKEILRMALFKKEPQHGRGWESVRPEPIGLKIYKGASRKLRKFKIGDRIHHKHSPELVGEIFEIHPKGYRIKLDTPIGHTSPEAFLIFDFLAVAEVAK
jgi:hypothetical protein